MAVVAAALAMLPSRAAAQVTFGADLNRPVNYAFDCGAGPGVGAFGEQILYFTNVQTCTWMAAGRNFGQQEGFNVPNGVGTITTVRIKVGAITGPMQVVVLRSIRSALGPVGTTPGGAGVNVACCKEVARSGVFTPAPNAVNTVAVNLPVKADIVPNPITLAYDFDTLALSVLAPGVPIPVHDTGSYQDITGPAAGIFFPAILPGQERADAFGTIGYQVLMQADWVPVQAAAVPPTAIVTLVQPVATVRRNFLLLSLRCNQATPCAGALLVQNRGAGVVNGAALAARVMVDARGVTRAAAKRAKVITVARAEFSIPAGQTQEIRAKITRQGKKLVRKRKGPALYANLTIGGQETSAGSISVSR